VLQQHLDLLRQAEKVRSQARNQRQQDRARQLSEIELIRAQLDMEARQIDATRAQLLEDERNETARLSRDARQIESELDSTEARRSAAIREMDLAQWQIADLVTALDCEPDPGRHALLRTELARSESNLARLDALVRRYDLEISRLIRRRRQLAQDHLAFRQRYHDELRILQQREIQLAEGEQQLATKQRKLLRKASDWSPRAGNLATRAGALTTYEVFPLEAERQRLLKTFE
jgi:hypothetical protein